MSANTNGPSAGQIVKDFSELVGLERGDGSVILTGPAASESPLPGSIVFCAAREHLPQCLQTAACVVVPKGMELPDQGPAVVLRAQHLQLAMAQINGRYFTAPARGPDFTDLTGRHASAVCAPSAEIDGSALIGPLAVIADGAKIGANAVIGAGAYIGAHATIGARTHIHPQVYIGPDCHVGQDCVIEPTSCIGAEGYGYGHGPNGLHVRKPHYGPVIIEDRVEMGCGVHVDRGTFREARIGAGTKIDNMCHFGHNVQIGKSCLITGGMLVAGSVTIGDNCIFGGRVTIGNQVTIPSDTQVAAMSGVQKSIDRPGRYGGYPVLELSTSLKSLASLQHLPRLRKLVARLAQKLGVDEAE